MKIVRFILVLVFLFCWARVAAAEHSPLLPRPQQIRYGSGRFPVRGLSIHLPSAPSAEDRFAADQLANFLSDRAKAPILVSESRASERAIDLKRTGPVDPLPLPDEKPGPESREAYWLKVTREGGEIRAASSAGLFYGVQTFCQLVEGSSQEPMLPEVEIHDWPSLVYRGPMVDMSHGPLPTEEEIKRQLDFLARWKSNQYYFYSEASIELEGYPLLNPEGRFTKDQVRRIIEYGRERHIDVIPCLELYGHLHDLFRVERYSDLSAFPHGGEFNPSNEKVMALLTDWAGQITRLFSSPFVHIGFDETWQIEKAAKQQGVTATPAKLYIEQLSNVTHLFEQRGKRVMAWGDIMVKYPEILSQLPSGLMAVAWEYVARPDPEYKRWLGPLVAKRVPHLVATGVHSWNEISPDFDTTFENIDTFLAAGRRSNALGLINTVWTDDAQMLMRMSWPGMAYGAAAPWQSTPIDRAQFFSDYARLMYPSAVAPEVASGLEALTKAENRLQKVLGQHTMIALWDDALAPRNLKRAQEHSEDLRQTRLLAEEAQEYLYRALSLGGDPTTLSSLILGSRQLDYAGMKNLYAVEIADLWAQVGPHPGGEDLWVDLETETYAQDHGRIADLMDAITDLRGTYQAAWSEEYTPYRMFAALRRWDAEYEYWRKLQERMRAFWERFHKGDTVPSLDSLIKGQ